MERGIGSTEAAKVATEVVVVDGISGQPVVGTAVYTDKSGTVTQGGTAQTLMAANSSRRGFSVQNNSTGNLTISSVGTASTTAGFIIAPGQMYEAPAGGVPRTAISILGATTGQRFDAREW